MFRHSAMAAAGAPAPSDIEVRVQKVDKLDLVYNILTKPRGPYGGAGKGGSNLPVAPPADGGGAGGKKHGGGNRGIVSVEDINKRSEKFISDRKRMFLGLN
uniref:Uncharacterized protein n=1 Tax=Oryza brachyantha TaxID=4533 RepID=J3M3V6_ORYBR